MTEAIKAKVISTNLDDVTTRSLYISFIKTLPPPAIEISYVERDWPLVWKRLHNGVFTQSSRDILFLIVHERIYTRERGHRLMPGRVDDNLCLRCFMGSETVQHKYVKCLFLSECWKLLRDFIDNLEPFVNFRI